MQSGSGIQALVILLVIITQVADSGCYLS